MRGCATKLGEYLGSAYEVSGTIMPGSRLQNITKLPRDDIAGLSHKDTVIIWGGSNDVNRNETNNGLNHLNAFINQSSNTNVMIVKVPLRHDLMASSCVNNEVETFNNKFYNIMENKDNMRILDHQATREDFTRHGLHLNGTDKNKVVKLMSQKICQLLKVKLKHPIIEKRRSTLNEPSFVDSVPQDINEDQVVIDSDRRKEVQTDSSNYGMHEDHVAIDSDRRNEDDDRRNEDLTDSITLGINENQVVIGSDRRNEGQSDPINQRIKEDYVAIYSNRRNEDQTDSNKLRIKEDQVAVDSDRRNEVSDRRNEELMDSTNQGINEDHGAIDSDRRNEDQTDSTIQGKRKSSRPKRLPNTRSDDFLWV
jgi:hypothetical protein